MDNTGEKREGYQAKGSEIGRGEPPGGGSAVTPPGPASLDVQIKSANTKPELVIDELAECAEAAERLVRRAIDRGIEIASADVVCNDEMLYAKATTLMGTLFDLHRTTIGLVARCVYGLKGGAGTAGQENRE